MKKQKSLFSWHSRAWACPICGKYHRVNSAGIALNEEKTRVVRCGLNGADWKPCKGKVRVTITVTPIQSAITEILDCEVVK